MWVHALADADALCGGKAAGLARLIAAGLPVPSGFVIDTNAFHHVVGDLALDDPNAIGHALAAVLDRIAATPLPDEVVREIDARADALVAPDGFAVRSSATIEDRQAGAAAGVFSSRQAVPRAELWHAIRAVWLSALTPLAVTYARRLGGPIAIGVIVQPYVLGDPSTIYTRPPGAPAANEVLVQRETAIARFPREAADPAVALALRAEAAIGAASGADVELVGDVVVQARPIVHPSRRAARSEAPPTVTALLGADGRRWTWDIAHNPDPLSTAQAELVERIEQANVAPYALRVCSGYLYSTPRTQVTAPAIDKLGDIEARLAELVGDGHGLEARGGEARGGERAGDARGLDARGLDDAIDRFVRFYAIWSMELSPLVASVRPTTPHARRSSVEALLMGVARGQLDEADVLGRLGVLSPSWDVAVATYAERPETLHTALERAREVVAYGREPAAEGPEPTRRVDNPYHADSVVDPTRSDHADLSERDDYWFARAQWLVRRALLARGRELGLDDGDVFWLPFATLADITVDDARRRAAAARAQAARVTRWDMPLVVGGESAVIKSGPISIAAIAAAARGDKVLRGIGSGGQVRGRVVRFATLASAVSVGRGDVVVARAITPALAVMVIGCAAIVSETGGFLDHGAAMARELGIPCVVGCRDAWSALDDGMIVSVDGDAGLVTTSS